MHKKLLKSMFAVLMAFCVFFSVLPIVSATADNTQGDSNIANTTNADEYYSFVLTQYKQNGYKDYKGDRITFDATSILSSEQSFTTSIELEDKTVSGVVWDKQQEKLTFNITVEQEGLYNIGIAYRTLEGSGSNIQRKILLNGEVPFEEAKNIEFLRFWKDTNAPLKDDNGDEVKVGDVIARFGLGSCQNREDTTHRAR